MGSRTQLIYITQLIHKLYDLILKIIIYLFFIMVDNKLTLSKYPSYQLSRWWPSNKSLGPRGLLPLWSQVQVLWLLI
jgi:hypothetical protein